MEVTESVMRALITRVADRVIAGADELSALDRAIGDGDHGINMRRGFQAILGDRDVVAAQPLPEALRAIGTCLVMKVGGASGPLYGTLFLALGRELPPAPDLGALTRALTAAIQAVKARGRSDVGAKTMLDVLVPVLEVLGQGGPDLTARVRARAAESAQATVPMRATRGRASFLGERSIGHMDPGARSSALMIDAVCEVLEDRP